MTPRASSRPAPLTDLQLDAPHVTEARRILQALERRSGAPSRKAYLVTSAIRGEGKSTICALLAIAAARIFHKRTLVIDADAHRPSLHRIIGTAQYPGLYEVLQGTVSLDSATRSTVFPTLHCISSGRVLPPYWDSFQGDALLRALETARGAYDIVFVDGPPAVPVVETLQIAERVDGIIVVALAGSTPIPVIRRMRKIMAPVEDRVVGAVLNNATDWLPYYYDYRYYGYRNPNRLGFHVSRGSEASHGTTPRASVG